MRLCSPSSPMVSRGRARPLAVALGASQRTVQRALDSLADAGKVQFVRSRAGASLDDAARAGIHDDIVTSSSPAEGDESVLRRVDPRTGEVLEKLEMPSGVGISGLESDGGDRFFCGGGRTGKVRAVRRPRRHRRPE
jgi:hypothetical protein